MLRGHISVPPIPRVWFGSDFRILNSAQFKKFLLSKLGILY